MYNQKTPGKTSSKLNKEQSDPYNNQDFYRRSLSTFDLDGSDVVDYSMMQRTASVMLTDTYERNSSILDFTASPQTRVMDKKKMKDMDVTFKNKAAWKKDSVCSVCSKNVDSGRHHCRLCASTVCGSCSNRKINDKRVCDTCFYKKKLEVQEKRMDDSLARMDDTAKETNNMLRRTKENYAQEQERCRQFEKQVQQEAAIQEESKEKQSKVKYGFLNNLNKAKEINQNLNSGIEKNKTDIAEKESKLRSLRTKLATLNLDVSQKKQKYEDLTQKFESLLQKHKSINEGRRSESVISEIAPGPGPAIVAKNYSILGNDKGGKYNISVQPVNI